MPKDPSIRSNLEYDAWAFIKVEMPTVSAQVEGEDAETVHDAFNYVVNDGWELIEVEDSGQSDIAGTDSVYIYAYKTPLAAGNQTSTLFDEMTVPDYTKLLNGLEGSVDITGYLIQTEGFASYTDAAKELGFEGSETDPGGEDEPEEPGVEQNISVLRSAGSIRRIMASLSGQTIEDTDYDTAITNVKYFKRSQSAPGVDVTAENIEASGQPEVLMWFDEGSGTIYYYTEADKVALPQDGSSDMFNGFSELISADLNDFDVTNATSLEYFFSGCTKLREINVSNWNTGNVTNIRGMCYGCKALTDIIGIENWNTHSLTDTHEAFYECASLENIDLSKWDVSSLTDMSNMFRRACKLSNETTASMNNWKINTSADFSGMFKYCNDPNEGGRADFQFPTWDGQWDETEGTFTPNT